MITYVDYHLSRFRLISLHKMRDLATSLKSPQTRTWTQNDLQLAFKSSKILEILRDTLHICFLYVVKISTLLVMTTNSYHFQKKLTSKLGPKFRYLNLTQYISKWLEIFLRYIILYDLYNSKAKDLKKLRERRYDQKIRFDIESSKTHNSHKTNLLFLKLWK
jgi:hypothetical protein